ncbi:MAG: pyridoxal-phosphate dependent enzyme [Propionibacteriales bacterium]|nr:pyridoxal-phosphate dependent enzyme [Propionibacteriales bacterium]
MTTLPPPTVTRADLDHAARVVNQHLVPTPLIEVDMDGHQVLLKLESLQPTGAFKVRGALVAAAFDSSRTDSQPRRLITASAGNHGLGVAWACSRLGVAATVVVPTTASPAKIAALRQFPIELLERGDSYDEAEDVALDLVRSGKGRYVSAYNDPQVIAGQGTLVDELETQMAEEIDEFDIVVPVGGGGLAAGVSMRAKCSDRHVTVTGVEALASTAVSTAVATREIRTVTVGNTVADGLAGNIADDTQTPAILAAAGTRLLTVDEDAIRHAVRTLALSFGLVVEGSAAAGIAALLTGTINTDRRTTVVVVTGRNISADTLTDCLGAG